MPQSDLVIRGRRVVLSNSLVPASIHVRAGRISAIKEFEDIAADCGVVEAGKDSVVMPGLARLGAMLIVHAEVPGPIDSACCQALDGNDGSDRSYATFLRSRPRAAENEAVELMVRLSRATNCRIHIVHHSSADALAALRAAKASGAQLTVETCPHYLHFAAEDISDRATEFKCCPPIRERANREQLWEALGDGTIDMVVSDHSPCPPDMKLRDEGDFMKAWGGISSLQLRLPVMWTEANARGFTINQMAE